MFVMVFTKARQYLPSEPVQTSFIHANPRSFYTVRLILAYHLHLNLQNNDILSGLPIKIIFALLASSLRGYIATHLITVFITLTIFYEQQNLRNSLSGISRATTDVPVLGNLNGNY
jgi:hypothetical protein